MADNGELLRFFKALAHESRLKLVGLVAQQERSVQELAALIGLKEPTVSHHLMLLKEAGIVRSRVDGTTHWYALEAEAMPALARRILNAEEIAGLAGDVTAASWDDHVLRSFVSPDGVLKEIPASRRKREVVLAWLVHRLEMDQRYSETQINEMLKRHHPDCATLRREFIGYRMMARDNGMYWRLPADAWATEATISGRAA